MGTIYKWPVDVAQFSWKFIWITFAEYNSGQNNATWINTCIHKGLPITCDDWNTQGAAQVQLYSWLISAMGGGPLPASLYPWETHPVPILKGAGQEEGPLWMGMKKRKSLTLAGVQTPDHPTTSESKLNMLSQPYKSIIRLKWHFSHFQSI
jgi:hypothetical protein